MVGQAARARRSYNRSVLMWPAMQQSWPIMPPMAAALPGMPQQMQPMAACPFPSCCKGYASGQRSSESRRRARDKCVNQGSLKRADDEFGWKPCRCQCMAGWRAGVKISNSQCLQFAFVDYGGS
eukprot:5231771-Amphidinium_carterae.1